MVPVSFLADIIVLNTHKSLKVTQINITIRPRFRNGIDASSTPPPETPASWPPRPALTVPRQTLVAGHVVYFSLLVVRPFTQPIPTRSIHRPQPICDVFVAICGLLGVSWKASVCLANCGKHFLHFGTEFLYFEIICTCFPTGFI